MQLMLLPFAPPPGSRPLKTEEKDILQLQIDGAPVALVG